MKWNEKLPDVTIWQPRSHRNATLSKGLLMSCQAAQSRILREAEIERRFNVDNFDSGPGLEDLMRQELSKLLPDRYSVDAGVVNDREGHTAGDYEVGSGIGYGPRDQTRSDTHFAQISLSCREHILCH